MRRYKWKLSFKLPGWLMHCSELSQTEGEGVIPDISSVAFEKAEVASLGLDDSTVSVTDIL